MKDLASKDTLVQCKEWCETRKFVVILKIATVKKLQGYIVGVVALHRSKWTPWQRRNANSRADGFQLNESKCNELRVSFTKSGNTLEPVTINSMNIKIVSSAKLLGVMVSNDLEVAWPSG